jgi:transposase
MRPAGFHDLTTRRVVAVVEGRTADVVQATLEQVNLGESVRVVSMDMARAYRAAGQLVCPQALIPVETFHVIKRSQEAVAAVWRRLARGLGRDAPLRRDGRLVLRNREDLDHAAWARLRPLLRQYPALRRAWLLKEDFRRWYRTATPRSARLELRAWERAVADWGLPDLVAVGGMFREWREEILTYFTTRVTQGSVEGRNRCAKLVQRQGYGYRNLANFTVRLQLLSGPSP